MEFVTTPCRQVLETREQIMKTYTIMDEVSRKIPADIRKKYGDSALFTAYGCVLLEKENKKSYSYSAQNLKTGRSEILCRKKTQLTTSGAADMTEKIRLSPVAGKGILQVDMPHGENLMRDSLRRILLHIFENILPGHGYALREKQAELAAHILDAIGRRCISLSEAEVGTGKTHAYLIAAALAKRGRINDFWLGGYYPRQSYAESAHMPVIISTSSIALQNAIVKDYIPEISRILLEHGIITEPLTCVVRKGKEHYLCRKNLETYLADTDARTRALLAPLSRENASIDLGAAEGLTPYIRRRIGVTGRCDRNCPHYDGCRYLRYLDQAKSGQFDFQVCNHNYFLADTLHRANDQRPLIPHYQAVIIDEAHKLLGAARQMYGVELSSFSIPEITGDICEFTYQKGINAKGIGELAISLYGQGKRLFMLLEESIQLVDDEDESERFAVTLDKQSTAHIHSIRKLCGELLLALRDKPVLDKYFGRCSQILWELERLQEQAAIFEQHGNLVYWLEKPRNSADPTLGDELLLCGIPKHLDKLLYQDLWRKQIPAVLTSGTLSAGGSFERIKRVTGLHRLPADRLLETSKPSPFDHSRNSILYISKNVPFPNIKDPHYIRAVADEAQRLIRVSHGHAAVLFTSYKAMDMVFEILSEQNMGFPLFRLDRGGAGAIEKFRHSGNGVLFASGAMWEGIDLPGDILSMLIIPKLPFPVPDPISEYERTLYPNMNSFKDAVVKPEMALRLKQGGGRLLRTVKDTGVIALFDIRASEGEPYHDYVLNALPSCPVTNDIAVVEKFYITQKPPAYFM